MIASLLYAQSSSDSAVTEMHYVLIAIFLLYFLPTVTGAIRKVPNIVSVFVVNFFLGWTLVGWVVALAMAARTAPPPGYPPVAGYPPPTPPPWPPPGSRPPRSP